MKAIDAHTHLFPPTVVRQRAEVAARDAPFAAIYGNERAPMADLEQLLAYLDGSGIDRCVALGYPFRDPGLLRECNDYILEAGKKSPRIIPFTGIGAGTRRQALAEAGRCLSLGARGFGEAALVRGRSGRAAAGVLDDAAEMAAAQGVALMLHVNEQVGHSYPGKASLDLQDVVRFCGAHRGTKTILAHLGGGLCFYEFMPEVGEALSHVFYDTAAAPYLYLPAALDFLARFLGRRVLFGSDFPLLPLRRYEGHLAGLDRRAREGFLYRNARRFFGHA